MSKIIINQNQFSDLLNIKYKVFYPLKKPLSIKNSFKNIKKCQYEDKFFPFPVFFGLTKKNYLKIKNCSQIDLIYKRSKNSCC